MCALWLGLVIVPILMKCLCLYGKDGNLVSHRFVLLFYAGLESVSYSFSDHVEGEELAAALASLPRKHISDPCLSAHSRPTTEVNVTVHGDYCFNIQHL